MAEFEKKKHAQEEFNKGNKYVANDGVQPATINNLVENSLYTEAFAESLASTPDTTNVAQTGTPSVELVDNPSAGITGAKKFKFSNLKGEQGHGYLRANVSLDTTATSVPSSNIDWGSLTEALVSDSIVDNNGNVFAVTARTAATSPTIPISHMTSIRGTAGADGTDGEDGDSVFIRYSASSNGSNMTDAPAANTRYIGFYRGHSASNTASEYTWSQYVGKEISEVTIDEFSFVITYDDGTTSTAPLNTENCLVTYAVPADEATAMTAYLVPSNADLNDYRGENYWGKTFYAGGSNTVRNTPVAGTAFNLEVLRSGALETAQRITMMAAGSTVYTRSVSDSTATSADGTWTQWQEIAETNGTYPDMTVGNSTNATNDGGGNNIAATYATQSALSSGLAGKANTSGTYSGLTVGNATNATNDGGGNNIANTYATQSALSSGLAGKANTSGTYPNITVGTATNATNIIPNEKGVVNPAGRKADSVVGDYSTALGYNSTASGLASIALGTSSTASGAYSTALGREANAANVSTTALGATANASSAYATALGNNSTASGSYSTALGYGATISSTSISTMQLGHNNLSALRCAVNLTVTSDKRDKTDIEGITDALAFLERLNPVTFVSNDRVDYISDEDKKGETFRTYGMCDYDRMAHAAGTKKGERRRCGLLAQEVVEAMQSVYGTDNYADVVNDNFHDLAQKPSDVENKYTLAYANLVPFLVGAIKELNAKIKALEGKLATSM